MYLSAIFLSTIITFIKISFLNDILVEYCYEILQLSKILENKIITDENYKSDQLKSTDMHKVYKFLLVFTLRYFSHVYRVIKYFPQVFTIYPVYEHYSIINEIGDRPAVIGSNGRCKLIVIDRPLSALASEPLHASDSQLDSAQDGIRNNGGLRPRCGFSDFPIMWSCPINNPQYVSDTVHCPVT